MDKNRKNASNGNSDGTITAAQIKSKVNQMKATQEAEVMRMIPSNNTGNEATTNGSS